MASTNRQTWQKESLYHGSVLKNYRSFSGVRSNLQSQTMPQLTTNLHWKQPGFSVHKMTKNPTKPLPSSKNQYSFNKLHSVVPNSSTTYKNKRTVLYNQNKSLKNSLVVQSQINQITKDFSVRKVMNKRTVVNEGINKGSENSVLNNKNDQNVSFSVSPNICKVVPSNSQILMKELTTVIQQLKKASGSKDYELKRQTVISKTEDKQNAIVNNLPSNSNSSRFNSFNKYNLIKSKNTFSKKCDNLIPTLVNRADSNSYLAFHNKQQTLKNNTKTNLSFKGQNSFGSGVQAHRPFYLNKYCYENLERQTLNSNTKNISKGLENKDQKIILEISKKSVAKPQSLEQVVHSDHRIGVPNANFLQSQYKISTTESKELMSKKQMLSKKVAMIKESSKYRMVKKGFDSVPKVKSPVISNSKMISMYSKVNQRNSLMLKMIDAKQKNFRHSHKVIPISKKIKRKVNLKYKVINKADTPSFDTKVASMKNNQSSKENSPLLVDKFDPLYELLHESSTIDKLEKDLLAITSSLTDTPKSILKQTVNDKMCQKPCNKVNSKFCLKKTHVKKPEIHASKYKVVNKHSKLQNCISLKRKSIEPLKHSARKMNNKVICSKFSIINKHPEPVHNPSPVFKGKSVLMKRLYKSKNAIINKNGSPTNISAKMIKSKYFTLCKRKSPHWQRHISYPKVSSGLQKFKGHCGMNKFSKQGRYQKSTFVCHPKVSRKFSNYHDYMTNYKFNMNSRKGRWMKKKVNIGQIQRNKIAKRIVHNKAYIRAGNVKATSPISANLASRALHRSINRVLTASNKKNLRKVNTYCMFYNRFGRCNRGVKCTYIHDPSKIAVCTRFLRGTCKINGCPFSHEITPGKMAICSFFLMDACEKEKCPYRHEKLSPDAELCKAFFQGYCPNGMECKKAHILICPKFIQGECEKGISCAYPHPPQKTKKNVLKDVAEKDEKKLDDILLEKVARYFQPCKEFVPNCQNTSDKNEIVSFVCPKRRQLEEQPSFIPLCDTSVTSQTQNLNH